MPHQKIDPFEEWITLQGDEVLQLWNERESLKSEDFANLEDQVSQSKAQLESLQTSLNSATQQAAQSEAKSRFYEQATAAGITNLKLALAIVNQEQMFTETGEINIPALKTQFPELFPRAQIARIGEGAGGSNRAPQADVNAWIRRAAGRSN